VDATCTPRPVHIIFSFASEHLNQCHKELFLSKIHRCKMARMYTASKSRIHTHTHTHTHTQVPCLEIDGMNLVQTDACIRYLARKHDMMGKNEKEGAIIDMVHIAVSDIRSGALMVPFQVCVCACVHVCMCACVHVCMCACVHVWVRILHLCIDVYRHSYKNDTHTATRTMWCTAHKYIHTYVHTYIHTHTHSH
jgi:hypothetical protein